MTKEQHSAFAREAERRVRSCVLSWREREGTLPSVREIQRETSIASLATVHKYLHRLAETGEIALPEEIYPAARKREPLDIRHKRLRLAGGEELELSLVLLRGRDGQMDAKVVRCAPGGAEKRILSCLDLERRPSAGRRAAP